MPTYQYRCTDCTDEHEIVQRFTDDALTTCPTCQGTLRKVFSPVGVVFKGSGFYATDNRTKGKTHAAKPGAEGSGEASPAAAKAGVKPAKKDAAASSPAA